MALTVGNRPRKGPTKAALVLSNTAGTDISRQARIERLRQLVASGRYEVEVEKLALKILFRSLKQDKSAF